MSFGLIFCILLSINNGVFLENFICDSSNKVCDCPPNGNYAIRTRDNGDLSNFAINCPINGRCSVQCFDAFGFCNNAVINASSSRSLKVTCIGGRVCYGLNVIFPDYGQFVSDVNDVIGLDHILDGTTKLMGSVLCNGEQSCENGLFQGRIDSGLDVQQYPNVRHVACRGNSACVNANYDCGSGGTCELICDDDARCEHIEFDANVSVALLLKVDKEEHQSYMINNPGSYQCPNGGRCEISYFFTFDSSKDSYVDTVGHCPVFNSIKHTQYFKDLVTKFWCKSAICYYDITSNEYNIYYDNTESSPCFNIIKPIPDEYKTENSIITDLENDLDNDSYTQIALGIAGALIVLYLIIFVSIKLCCSNGKTTKNKHNNSKEYTEVESSDFEDE